MPYVVHPTMTDANLALQAQSAADPLLRANQACRIVFAVLGNLLCWVPFRQLTQHGELAASVLVADVVVLNAFTAANAALWADDGWAAWWDGAGLCDAEVWLAGPLQTVYAAAVFAVMRRLARQVARLRAPAAAPSAPERRRRQLAQALVIFPVPLAQFAATWFVLAQRYIVGALVGCSATYDSSWLKILIYSSPPALFALGAVPYAFLTWRRFRAIAHTAAAALEHPGNSAAAARAARTRRRLYQMSLSILVPYVPLMLAFFAFSIKDTGAFKPYSYHRIHHTADPYPWDSVMFVPSWLVPTEVLNQPWLPILTTVPIVLFFGLTHDALDTYRRYALALGLHRLWPGLKAPRVPVGAKMDSTLEDSHGSHWFRHGPRGHGHRETWDESHNEPTEMTVRPPTDPVAPSARPRDLADALERGQASHKRSPLDDGDTPVIPPRTSSLLHRAAAASSPLGRAVRRQVARLPSLRSRTASGSTTSGSSRLASLFGRPRAAAGKNNNGPGKNGEYNDDDDDDDVDNDGPVLPMLPLTPAATSSPPPPPPGETRIRIQTSGTTRTETGASMPTGIGSGTLGTTASTLSGEASLTDETGTDSFAARLRSAGSKARIREFGSSQV